MYFKRIWTTHLKCIKFIFGQFEYCGRNESPLRSFEPPFADKLASKCGEENKYVRTGVIHFLDDIAQRLTFILA